MKRKWCRWQTYLHHFPYATRTRRAAQILYTVRLYLASGLWTEKKGQDNRMGKILEALLTDQLRVDSGTERRTPEHQALCEKGSRLQDELAKTLNDTQKAILEELVENAL